MKVRVFVTLKPGVLDPQGQAVARTLGRLGYGEVESVRVGKYVELELGETDPARARSRVDEMCAQLIANTVIENYRVELDGEGGGAARAQDPAVGADKADELGAAAPPPGGKRSRRT